MKKNKSKRYSILIVPENDSHIRRFEFSKRALLISLSCFAVTCLVMCLSVLSLVHFYRAYSATENARLRSAQFEHVRASLVAKVKELEDSLTRTQRFAAKLGTLPKDGQKSAAGFGPLEGGSDSIKSVLFEGEKGAFWKTLSFEDSTGDVLSSVDLMKESTAALEKRLHEVFAKKQDKMYFWSSLPTIWPSKGFITSKFGVIRGHRRHEGLDIAGRVGTPIIAPGDGMITYRGYKGGYGKTIIIDHGYGISTVYGHCSRLFVQEGDRVKRGEVIASVGNTGRSTGPHLHYEVHLDGLPVNPMRYLAKR